MSEHISSSANDEILARVLQEIQTRSRESLDLSKYESTYPHLVDEIRQMAELVNLLDDSCPEGTETIPERLGDYRIVRKMTNGGMGDIYEAVQEPFDRRVVIKTIRHGLISPEAERRFEREQQILARLHQTNIVPIHSAGKEGSLHYFSMPFIDGATLRHVIQVAWNIDSDVVHNSVQSLGELARIATKHGVAGPENIRGVASQDQVEEAKGKTPTVRLGPEYFRSAARVMSELTDAIQHAHEVSVLHRDIKPQNVMVDRNEQSWIIDYGLGSIPKEPSDGPGSDGTAQPSPATGLIGTPSYMAPEQFKGRADVRTDVWGLGVTFYEMLALREAFSGKPDAVQHQICNEFPPRPRQLVSNVPRELEAIALKAIEKDPEKRYQSVAEFGDDLRHWLRGEPTIALRIPFWQHIWKWMKRNPGWAAALTTMGLIVFTSFFMLKEGTRRRIEERLKRESELSLAVAAEMRNRRTGWTRRIADRVQADQASVSDRALAGAHATRLAGLDALEIGRWPFAASRVAFSGDGSRLLFSGPGPTARIVEMSTAQVSLFEVPAGVGAGPSGFGYNGNAMQVAAMTPWEIQLLDLRQDRAVGSWKVGASDPVKLQEWDDLSPTVRAAHMETINQLAESTPDMSRIVAWCGVPSEVASQSGQVCVWDWRHEELLETVETQASALAISSDGEVFAIGQNDGTILVHRVGLERKAVRLSIGLDRVTAIAFGECSTQPIAVPNSNPSPARYLAAADHGGKIVVWELNGPRPVNIYRGEGIVHPINALEFSSDAQLLVSAGHRQVQLWDTFNGRRLLDFAAAQYRTDVALSPDSAVLAIPGTESAAGDADSALWDLQHSRGVHTLRGMSRAGGKVVFSRDGRLVASVTNDWAVGIWDIASRQLLHRLDPPKGYFIDNCSLAFTEDGRYFLFSAGESMTAWDLSLQSLYQRWHLPWGLQDQIAADTAGRFLLMRCETHGDGEDKRRVCRLRVMNQDGTTQTLSEFGQFSKQVYSIVSTRDGSYFAIDGVDAATNRQVAIIDGRSGQLARLLPSTHNNPSTQLLIADDAGQLLQLGPKNTGSMLFGLTGDSQPTSLPFFCNAVDASGRYGLLSDSQNGTNCCDFFELSSKRQLFRISVPVRPSLYHPDFSPDGRLAAWANLDGTVSVCDIERVRQEFRLINLHW